LKHPNIQLIVQLTFNFHSNIQINSSIIIKINSSFTIFHSKNQINSSMTNFHSTIQINSSFKHSLNSSINSSFNFSNTHRQREREIERTSPTSIRGGAGWRLSEEEVALGRCRRWGGDIIEEAACSVGALERLVWLRREWGAGGVGALRWADDVEGVGVGASARRCRCRALY
jgi:hypothetical protein